MQNAMAVAIDSNPQINQAEMSKEAIEFEMKQAQGLYLPRVTLEASAGVRSLGTATRRRFCVSNQELHPADAQLRTQQTLVLFIRGAPRRDRGEINRKNL